MPIAGKTANRIMKQPAIQPDNSFALVLQHQRQGDCLAELSDKLRELGVAVTSLGKSGKLTLEITMKHTGRGAGSAVAIFDKITLKEPKEEPSPAIFFVGNDGDLSRNDPRQSELRFESVRGETKETNETPHPEPRAQAS